MKRSLKADLVIIDPQNDFMDIVAKPGEKAGLVLPDGTAFRSTLPVPGALADMERVAKLIQRVGPKLNDIHVTLDSHRVVDVAHPGFWRDADGKAPAPFTMIGNADIKSGMWAPRNQAFRQRMLDYTAALETAGKFVLMIWPEHCLIGSWGHNIVDVLQAELAAWERTNFATVDFVTKGVNTFTEHYGALMAEVPDPADPSTQLNGQFLHCEIVRLPDGGWLIAIPIAGQATFGYVAADLQDRHLIDSPVRLRRIFRAGDRLFGVTDSEMVEILHQQFGKRSMITVGRRWPMMVNSTRWFDDVAVTDALGAAFVIIPSGDGVHQVRVHELDGAKIVTGKAGGRFAAFVALEPNGDYRKIELIFQKDFTKYQVWIGPADSPDLNMGILPRGVVATIVNDGELAIVVPSSGDVRKVADRGVTTEMKLGSWGETIVYIKDGAVWKMRMAP